MSILALIIKFEICDGPNQRELIDAFAVAFSYGCPSPAQFLLKDNSIENSLPTKVLANVIAVEHMGDNVNFKIKVALTTGGLYEGRYNTDAKTGVLNLSL